MNADSLELIDQVRVGIDLVQPARHQQTPDDAHALRTDLARSEQPVPLPERNRTQRPFQVIRVDGHLGVVEEYLQPRAACLALPLNATAALDCADWGTPAFFNAGIVTVAEVRRCLDAGAKVNARADNGWTALYFSAGFGHAEAITALFDAGANVDARNNDSATALHYAAAGGHAEAVTALLDAGANIEVRMEGGGTALLDGGADPKAKGDDGWIPFDFVEDDSPLKGTDACWRRHEAQY